MVPSRKAPPLETDVRLILESLGRLPASREAPALIMAVGLPGSGKSTFCRRLAGEIGAVILESDALRRRLFRQPSHLPAESRRLFRAIHEAARRLLEASVSPIIDATNLREAERRPVYALAESTGARLVVLHFRAPEAVVAERLGRRRAGADAADSSTAGVEVYRRLAEREEAPRRQFRLVDTASPEATEAALADLVAACRAAAAPAVREEAVP